MTPFECAYNHLYLTLEEAVDEVVGKDLDPIKTAIAPLWHSFVTQFDTTKASAEGTFAAAPKNLALAKIREWREWPAVQALVRQAELLDQLTALLRTRR